MHKTLHIGVFFAIIFAIVYPAHVHAGIFASLTGKIKTVFLPNDSLAVAETSSETSQTISLFKASVSSEEDEVYTQGSSSSEALSATTGPLRVSTEDIVYPEDDTINVYEVKKGDTLTTVASLFGVSKNTIMWANNLKSERLTPGDTLLILPITGIRHTVKKGDTVSTIAKKYKADINDVATYNGIAKTKELAVGDVLIVPEGEVAIATPTKTTITKKKPTIYTNTVSAGFLSRPIVGGARTQGIHGNNAVDIAATPGTNVLAAADGKVLIARASGYNGGYGNMIILSHANGVQTLYAHLRSVDITAGQSVAKGQVIGGVGSTGKSTGPHLHFEVRGAKNPF